MAIVPIRNLGGGSGGEAKPKFLYQNGVFKCAYQNGGVGYNSTHTSKGGWTLSDNSMSSTSNSNAGSWNITLNDIDLSQYSKVTIIGTSNSKIFTNELDISNLDGKYYLYIYNVQKSIGITVTSSISPYATSGRLAQNEVVLENYTITITEIKLTK